MRVEMMMSVPPITMGKGLQLLTRPDEIVANASDFFLNGNQLVLCLETLIHRNFRIRNHMQFPVRNHDCLALPSSWYQPPSLFAYTTGAFAPHSASIHYQPLNTLREILLLEQSLEQSHIAASSIS